MTLASSPQFPHVSSSLRARAPRRDDLYYGPDYHEPVVLADGSPARLLSLRPEHAPELLKGFARLSQRSRYHRFFGAKRVLSPEELKGLTVLDGQERYAIAAIVRTLRGWEGAAVGRIVRVAGTPGTAEFAITVLDEFQRRGLGRLLLDRLANAARERGYHELRGEVLAENRAMLGLLRDAAPGLRTETKGVVVIAHMPLR
jgi:ribosomal protein S18 acetylase RimI-like enzyme